MRAARARRPRKWGWLPGKEIANRLRDTEATVRSIAAEYGCSPSTVSILYRRHSTGKERQVAKYRKGAAKKRGRPNPVFAEWRRTHSVWSGRKHSAEARKKQSVAKKGKKHSLKKRIAQSAKLQGCSVEEWKGFASTETERAKGSEEYRNWREAVFARDDWTCQHCYKRGGRLHPHHIKPKSIYPEAMFDLENGVTLCETCHRKTSSYGTNKRYRE